MTNREQLLEQALALEPNDGAFVAEALEHGLPLIVLGYLALNAFYVRHFLRRFASGSVEFDERRGDGKRA